MNTDISIWQEFSFPIQRHRQSMITTSLTVPKCKLLFVINFLLTDTRLSRQFLDFDCHPGPTARVRYIKAIFF